MKKSIWIIIGIIFTIQLYAQQSKTGPNRPAVVHEGLNKDNYKSTVLIDGVPAYLWHRGCGPTSLGMIIGYYDTHGFPDLIVGDATNQTDSVNNAIANKEHTNDYSIPLDYYPNLEQDKSDLGGAHTSNCIADFMETSWSSKNNYWGWSWSSKIDDAFRDYINLVGDYETFDTYEYFSTSGSWYKFTNEIDHERPVLLLVDSNGDGSTDHFVTGIGYDESDTTYAIYDTWDKEIHWFKWREMSSSYSWGIYGFNILKFQFNIAASSNIISGGTIYGNHKYDLNDTATLVAIASSGYKFVNWTENNTEVSENSSYSFKVTDNRTLTANFEAQTSVDDLQDEINISIYPNPVYEMLNIEVEGINSKLSYEIINIMGQVIVNESLDNKNRIDISELVVGEYIVRIKNREIIYSKKIIKK